LMQILGAGLSSLYYIVCFLLVLYGLYRVWLLFNYLRAMRHLPQTPTAPQVWPRVTVQLPLFNERWVARRLLQAVARMDYPKDRMQIQVLDDSTDRTVALTRRLCAVLRQRGFDVQHLPRSHRTGYKAGALAAGLKSASGELIAIFDADFVPPTDFLKRMVPWVMQPGVGVAQARWGHLNRETSWFTRLQAILLDGHFVIEQAARSHGGFFLSFNGTCGIWRRDAIDEAGGWGSDTVTEDLDLSFRAQLAGWRVQYVWDLVVPGELPIEPNSFRSQQRRWTKGGVQVARKLLPTILKAAIPARVKLEAFLHLTCYSAYPLLLLLALLRTPARIFAPETNMLGLLPGEVQLLLVGTVPLLFFYSLAQRGAGGPHNAFSWLTRSLPAMALGAGLAVSNTRAVLEGLFSRDLTFERTPKQGSKQTRHVESEYRVSGSAIAVTEILLVLYIVLWKVFGTGIHVWADLPFVLFFGSGLLAMALPSFSRVRRPPLSG
jgi:cellulose synthase/poly-beta-1,6-N-acetylglucosamine synthase-like glycosyltransferase